MAWLKKTENKKWFRCHHFAFGFGRTSENADKRIFVNALECFLKIKVDEDPNFTDDELDDFYNRLQPLILERLEQRRKYLEENPSRFDEISVPLVRKVYPHLIALFLIGLI